jgi:hypothetical protein
MATHNGQEPAPPRERGHYSEDNRRWWEETSGRWPPPTEEGDTLEIELEDARLIPGGTVWPHPAPPATGGGRR